MKIVVVAILVVLAGACLAAESHWFRPKAGSLAQAIEGGDLKQIRASIEGAGDVNAVDRCGRTPLEMAAWTGNLAAIELLLSRGAKADQKDDHGYTPLCCAATRGDIAVMRALMRAGANVNSKDESGRTPLHDAIACMGSAESIEFLLSHGADPKIAAADGWTPLHQAAVRGDVKVVQILLAAGAAPRTRDADGHTAFGEACRAHEWSVAHLLRHRSFASARSRTASAVIPVERHAYQ